MLTRPSLVAFGLLAAAVSGCSSELAVETQVKAQPAFADPIPCQDLAAEPQPKTSDGPISSELLSTYERSCKLCHENPGAGAPLRGNADQWAKRLEQGREVLLDHTINGFGAMPPLGLCMDCSEDELGALVEYMSGAEL